MTDTQIFCKADLLAGKDQVYEIDIPEIGGTVKLRKLTAKEQVLVAARKLKGVMQEVDPGKARNTGKISVDIGTTISNEFAGATLMITYGMAGEKWTEEDAQALPDTTFKALAREIERLSTLTDKQREKISNFRAQ